MTAVSFYKLTVTFQRIRKIGFNYRFQADVYIFLIKIFSHIVSSVYFYVGWLISTQLFDLWIYLTKGHLFI